MDKRVLKHIEPILSCLKAEELKNIYYVGKITEGKTEEEWKVEVPCMRKSVKVADISAVADNDIKLNLPEPRRHGTTNIFIKMFN